jgi:hypothetical protein
MLCSSAAQCVFPCLKVESAHGSKAAVQEYVALVASRKREQRTAALADGSLGLSGLCDTSQHDIFEPAAKRRATGE